MRTHGLSNKLKPHSMPSIQDPLFSDPGSAERSPATGRLPLPPPDRARHSCTFCAYTTAYRTNLLTHERTHTGERPYQCPLCPKAFAQNTTLVRHVQTHTRHDAKGVPGNDLPSRAQTYYPH